MSKKIISSIKFSLFVLVSVAALLHAGNEGRNGTSAASQLLVPQGAQFLSGGGAVAGATGLESAYWNPAGLSRTSSNVEALFSRRNYIADIDINYFGASMKFGENSAISMTVRAFDIGDIMITDEFNPDGTGGKFSPSVFVVGGTFSKQLTDRTSVGISANYLNESFEGVKATGFTFDAGVQYNSFLEVEGLSIGVALRNFGNPMTYSGSGMWVSAEVDGSDRKTDWYKVDAAPFDMPFLMDIGFSYSPTDLYSIGLTYQENNYGPNSLLLLGCYNFGIAQVRAGYLISEEQVFSDDLDLDAEDVTFDNIFQDFSIGATLDISQFVNRKISLDYGYIPTEFFDANQIFTIHIGF